MKKFKSFLAILCLCGVLFGNTPYTNTNYECSALSLELNESITLY